MLTPVIDNARVTVRDIHLEPGKPGPAIPHAGYFAVLYFDGGRVRIADGNTVRHPAGDAVTGQGGVTHDTAIGKPQREIVVEIKDAPSNTVPNTTGLPPGFPREGSKKVFENDKVNVWNYTWLPGKPTPMHFHNTEIVVTYLGNGDVAATTQLQTRKLTIQPRAFRDGPGAADRQLAACSIQLEPGLRLGDGFDRGQSMVPRAR